MKKHDAFSMTPPSLAESYAECRRITRRAGSSFYYPLWLLAKEKRKAMYALYAFCRIVDDIGDGPAEVNAKRQRLSDYRTALTAALQGASSRPELPALADAVRRFDIPSTHLFEILDGVEMDLTPRRYPTWDDLRHYCYHVAGAVGLACLAIWGGQSQAARAAAVRCGEAFQLTNILRDVREDALHGRVYLPQEDIAAFHCAERDLRVNRPSPALRELMAHEVARAKEAFRDAAQLDALLPRDARRVFIAMWCIYASLLNKIERRQGDVFSERVRLSKARRLWIVASTWRGASIA
jgi:phytoene synthase